MGLRRLSESREREVAPHWFSAPGLPFSGSPVFPPSPRLRHGDPLAWDLPPAPLGDLRDPTGHLPKINRQRGVDPTGTRPSTTSRRLARPPGLLSPTALSESEVRLARAYHTRHVPASAFPTLSPASSPRSLPGLFHPGDAHGVLAFRASFPAGGRTSFEAAPLLPFDAGRPETPRFAASEVCSHRGSVPRDERFGPVPWPLPSWPSPL